MSSSFLITQEVNAQTVIWAIGGAIYQLPSAIRSLIAYLVSWEPAAKAACKFVASVAVLAGGLALTVTFPAIVVCGFVIVCVAYVSMPR